MAALQAENAALRQQVAMLEQTQEALRKSEERCRTVADFTHDWEYWVDPHGHHIYVSPSCERLTGYPPEAFQQDPNLLHRIIHPDDQQPVADRLRCQFTSSADCYTEFRIITRSGEERWIGHACMAVYDAEGRFLGRRASNRDITENRHLQEALRTTHAELERHVQERTEKLAQANQRLQQEIAEREQAEAALRESEARYREVTELVSDSVYSVRFDTDGTMTFEWGFEGFRKLSGYSPQERITNDWQSLVLPEDRPITTRRMELFFAGQPVESEYRIRTRKGNIRWLRDHGRPVWDTTENRLVRVYGAVKDVTEYKLAGQALRESERMLSTLMHNLPGMAYRCNNDQHWTMDFVSNGCKALTGYAPVELIASSRVAYGELVHPDDRQMVWDKVQAALARRVPFQCTYRIHTADQQEKWVWEQGMGVFWENGSLLALEGFITDITLHKHTEAALRESEARTRQYAARTEALAHVAACLNAQLDLNAVLHSVCEETGRALAAEIVTVMRYDKESDTLRYAYGIGVPDEIVAALPPLPRQPMDTMIEQARPIRLFEDIQAMDSIPHRDLLQRANIRTLVGVNIEREGQLIGLLSVATVGTVRTFTDDELLLVRGIADQAAQAIANARLFDAVQQERTLLTQRVAERTSELSRANAELSRAVRTKDEFLANMSHELRTPLNAILGLTESLQEYVYGPINERQGKVLQTVETSGRHLLELINDILDVAKIEAGKMELNLDTVTLEHVCLASMQFVKQQAQKKSINVSFANHTSIERIHADVRRLKQILVNLLTNAVKFTPHGGAVGLELRSSPDEDVVYLSIWDTGIGIAQEHMGRLFQSFVQLDSSLSREHVGTGLGLALVARLTEMHGGSIAVASAPGEGSRFTVSLPVVQEAVLRESEIGPATHRANPGPHNAAAQDSPTLPHYRSLILLAEDNEANIDLYSEFLQSKGYRVIVARNGKEAIERAQEECPTLILMDIQMPRMNGLEAMHSIRNQASTAHIPIIALTALAMPGDRERCLEAGANEYLSKPVNLKHLLQTIAQQIAEERRPLAPS